MRSLRAVAADPITDWVMALLNLLTGVVAILALVMQLPIVPPDIAVWLVTVVAVLNTVIAFLKKLVPPA